MADYGDIQNALIDGLPDLDALFRAAQVFELQEVERRIECLGDPISVSQEDPGAMYSLTGLWKRRCQLVGALWPEAANSPSPPLPAVPGAGLQKVAL